MVFAHGIYVHFNLTLERANATHEIQQSTFKFKQGGDVKNDKKRKREQEHQPHFPFKSLKKTTP